MPPLAERFELLEETLRYAHEMFQGERGSEGGFRGRHVQAERLLNVPQSLSRPRVPILVGGGGERRTLRLVALYADACNVFGGPAGIAHKYAVLREHCQAVGRPYDEIERTTLQHLWLTRDGRDGSLTPAGMVERLGALAEAGAQHVIVSLRQVWDPETLELVASVIPQLRAL